MDNFEKIKGVVNDIYEEFDTFENIVKDMAVAFRLDTTDDKGNEEIVIVVYDKSAVKLGLIKIGESLTCFGSYSGIVAIVDSDRNVIEDKMFLCRGIMGSADIDEEQLKKQGAVRLR
jgi:hypothetical protein